ncbi:MAG: hypothetical protein MMC23_007086 [Stictis urceolatum]|nr:hypothetical protein [Stictis urceolata]
MRSSLTALAATLLSVAAARLPDYIEYSTVTGYFLQDDAKTNASTFDYTKENFGLISRQYDTDARSDPWNRHSQWQRFESKVNSLNAHSDRHTQYKVIWFGRHGEGFHNVAESYYGTPAWNCYWSLQDGNGTITWADAKLTQNGIDQAKVAHSFWQQKIKEDSIPTPQSFYTSPLTRCMSTAELTFSGLELQHPFVETVKELFREGISGHTCDRRQSKSYIRSAFPEYKIEKGFTEEDELFQPLKAETATDQDIRTKKVLDDVFRNDGKTFISVTSHSGEISSILRVLGHRTFSLNTGAVIPVLVKARTVGGWAPKATAQPYTPISTCASAPPLPTATA